MSRRDQGPVLAAVSRDEWEPALVIADRAGVNRRSIRQRLAALEREGWVETKWEPRRRRVLPYRRSRDV